MQLPCMPLPLFLSPSTIAFMESQEKCKLVTYMILVWVKDVTWGCQVFIGTVDSTESVVEEKWACRLLWQRHFHMQYALCMISQKNKNLIRIGMMSQSMGSPGSDWPVFVFLAHLSSLIEFVHVPSLSVPLCHNHLATSASPNEKKGSCIRMHTRKVDILLTFMYCSTFVICMIQGRAIVINIDWIVCGMLHSSHCSVAMQFQCGIVVAVGEPGWQDDHPMWTLVDGGHWFVVTANNSHGSQSTCCY